MSPDILREILIPQEGIEQSKDMAIPLRPDGTDEGNTGTDGVRRRPIGAEPNNTDDEFSVSRRKKSLLTKVQSMLTQAQGGF